MFIDVINCSEAISKSMMYVMFLKIKLSVESRNYRDLVSRAHQNSNSGSDFNSIFTMLADNGSIEYFASLNLTIGESVEK